MKSEAITLRLQVKLREIGKLFLSIRLELITPEKFRALLLSQFGSYTTNQSFNLLLSFKLYRVFNV